MIEIIPKTILEQINLLPWSKVRSGLAEKCKVADVETDDGEIIPVAFIAFSDIPYGKETAEEPIFSDFSDSPLAVLDAYSLSASTCKTASPSSVILSDSLQDVIAKVGSLPWAGVKNFNVLCDDGLIFRASVQSKDATYCLKLPNGKSASCVKEILPFDESYPPCEMISPSLCVYKLG